MMINRAFTPVGHYRSSAETKGGQMMNVTDPGDFHIHILCNILQIDFNTPQVQSDAARSKPNVYYWEI